jgi:hypothetical protein
MTDTIATLGVTLKGDAKALDAALAKAERDLRAFQRQAGSVRGVSLPPLVGKGDAQAIARAEAQTLAFARARASLARQSGDIAGAERILQGALSATTASTTATVNAQRQLVSIQQQAAGGTRTLTGTLGGLQAAFGAIGIGVGLTELSRFAAESISAANRLEDMQSSLRAIAGDTETYNKVIAAARANQELFGGSLADNVEDMTSFVISSRTAGVEMGTLIDISKRLATLDPGAGLKGANIALRELLSGNPRSLAARFELPAAAVKALGDDSLTATEKLAKLDEFLNGVGITSEALNARLENTSQAYRDLNTALDDLKTNFGTALADIFEAPTQGLTRLIGLINQNPEAIAELKALLSGKGSIDQGDIDAAARELEEKQARSTLLAPGDAGRGRANNADTMAGFGGVEQFDAIIQRMVALQQAGGPAAAALDQLNAQFRAGEVDAGAYAERLTEIEGINADPLIAIGAASAQLATDFQAGTAEAVNLSARMTELAGTSDANRLAVVANAQAYADGRISAAELAGAIAALEQAQAAQAAASAESNGATLGLADSLIAAAGAIEGTTLASRAQKAALEAAAAAAFEAENADKSLADQARAAASELLGAGAAGASAAAQLASSSSQIDVMTAALYRLLAAKQAALGGGGALGGLGGVVKGAGQATAAMRTLNKVYNAGPLAPRPTGGGGGGGGGRGAGGGGGGASAATKAADAEIKAAQDRAAKVDEIEERARETALAAEEAYQEERLSVIERYNEAVLEAQRDLQAESAGSRADFYDSLTQSDVPPEIAQQLSAAYETAFAEAQRLSQAGQAALAADYLALKQDQIAAEQKFQEAVQAAREKGDKAEVARLEQIKRLRDAEFAARESNLMAEGDQNVEARDAGLTDAEVKRQEALADAQAATAKAALDAEGKTLEAARLTNDTYLERLRLLQQIGPQAGGVPALPAVAAPDATATATALPAAPTGGGAVPVSDATVAELVRQSISTMQAVERAVGRINQRGTVGGLG